MRLSLCIIVKNEEKNLEPCIESVRPVIDEIIVVDTGSADDTRKITEKLVAKVFEFSWCDDFAAARNESIKYNCFVKSQKIPFFVIPAEAGIQ
ncbi:MAG: hypothetical protein SRB1_00644 [Desulfobacteraceae bacterium Eth-SRB1]|nr:MAG: hypothetical protein SRB1_00644 [Desulfobacteraceae bacterium Eth-SRB1]